MTPGICFAPELSSVRKRQMKSKTFLLLIGSFVFFAPHAASAETVNGSGALTLAALVGTVSPLLSGSEKGVLRQLLDGRAKFAFPAGKTICVQAGKLTCRASNVDLKSYSCALNFGSHDVALKGRRAHELYATLAEIGVAPDGAAGSTFEAVSNLKCTIDPGEVKQSSGGGANCDYAQPN
jgi:hypothetical protein